MTADHRSGTSAARRHPSPGTPAWAGREDDVTTSPPSPPPGQPTSAADAGRIDAPEASALLVAVAILAAASIGFELWWAWERQRRRLA